jgi:hypothetical protein
MEKSALMSASEQAYEKLKVLRDIIVEAAKTSPIREVVVQVSGGVCDIISIDDDVVVTLIEHDNESAYQCTNSKDKGVVIKELDYNLYRDM